MKQIHTITAILLAVKEFGTNKFSIWEITNKIRQHLNDGDYELLYGDNSRTYIHHHENKECFKELWDNGLLDNYDKSFNSQGYREFQLNDDTDNLNDGLRSPPVKMTVDDIANACNASGIPTDVQKKMYSYIKNNGPVTMKQIQSRLKAPYTCEQIKDFLSKIYLIDPNTSSNPNSQVKTVGFN